MSQLFDSGTHVSAPGRVILFGDHCIDFGGPGIALGIEQRVHCKARLDNKFTVNGEPLDSEKHPYTRGAVLQAWTDMDKHLAIELEAEFTAGCDLGLEAAKTVACLGALSMMHDHLIFEEIAKNAFEVNYDVDKSGNPLEISVATHGNGVLLSCHGLENPLWSFRKGDREWCIHDLELPEMQMVIGNTGIASPGREVNAKINRFYERNSFARDLMNDLCQISSKGHKALERGNLEELGELMTRSHKVMVTLGAGHPKLDKLVQASNRHSYGAKLTGSGGGGCMIALTDEQERVIDAINEAGGTGMKLELAKEGLRLED